jgi:hypothetical protein
MTTPTDRFPRVPDVVPADGLHPPILPTHIHL